VSGQIHATLPTALLVSWAP